MNVLRVVMDSLFGFGQEYKGLFWLSKIIRPLHFKLIDKQQLLEYSDDIELIFIELPKFNLTDSELVTAKDRWLYFVKNAGSLTIIPDSLAKEPHIHQAFDIANEAGMSDEELAAQERRYDFIRLQRGSIEKALQDGLEQGRQEMARKIATSLLSLLDDATIAANTGLSIDNVTILRN